MGWAHGWAEPGMEGVQDQMIWEFGDDEEPNWVHVSYKEAGRNRKQIKRAYRDEKGVHYKAI